MLIVVVGAESADALRAPPSRSRACSCTVQEPDHGRARRGRSLRDACEVSSACPATSRISHRALLLGRPRRGALEHRGALGGRGRGRHRAGSSSQLGRRPSSAPATRWPSRAVETGSVRRATPARLRQLGDDHAARHGAGGPIAGRHVLVGDASLSRRPMDRVAIPLRTMGAAVTRPREHTRPRRSWSEAHRARHRLRRARAQRPGEVGGPACRRCAASGRDHGREATAHPARHRGDAGAGRGRGHASRPAPADAVTSTRVRRSRHSAGTCPADPSQAAFFVVAGLRARRRGDLGLRRPLRR